MLPAMRWSYCCERFVPIFAELHDAQRRKIGKRGKRENDGSLDARIAACENFKICGAQWETDEFFVENGTFIDYKYQKEEK